MELRRQRIALNRIHRHMNVVSSMHITLLGPCMIYCYDGTGSRLVTRAETKDVDFDSILSGLADKVPYWFLFYHFYCIACRFLTVNHQLTSVVLLVPVREEQQ